MHVLFVQTKLNEYQTKNQKEENTDEENTDMSCEKKFVLGRSGNVSCRHDATSQIVASLVHNLGQTGETCLFPTASFF